jgi:hypothetical protein
MLGYTSRSESRAEGEPKERPEAVRRSHPGEIETGVRIRLEVRCEHWRVLDLAYLAPQVVE